MKKTIIALMCLILTTGAAMAQKTFTFGPKIGVDYFWSQDWRGLHTFLGKRLFTWWPNQLPGWYVYRVPLQQQILTCS